MKFPSPYAADLVTCATNPPVSQRAPFKNSNRVKMGVVWLAINEEGGKARSESQIRCFPDPWVPASAPYPSYTRALHGRACVVDETFHHPRFPRKMEKGKSQSVASDEPLDGHRGM